jgi:hypothetical protein
MQQAEKRRPAATARAQHRLFQDWEHVSRWIAQNLHPGKRAQSILGAFDCRSLLLPLGAMLAALALLAAVVPPFDARLLTQPLIDLRDIGTQSNIEMPWGPWVTVTFRGRVQAFAELPSNGAPFDMWQLADGSCWVWMPLPGTQSFSWVDP